MVRNKKKRALTEFMRGSNFDALLGLIRAEVTLQDLEELGDLQLVITNDVVREVDRVMEEQTVEDYSTAMIQLHREYSNTLWTTLEEHPTSIEILDRKYYIKTLLNKLPYIKSRKLRQLIILEYYVRGMQNIRYDVINEELWAIIEDTFLYEVYALPRFKQSEFSLWDNPILNQKYFKRLLSSENYYETIRGHINLNYNGTGDGYNKLKLKLNSIQSMLNYYKPQWSQHPEGIKMAQRVQRLIKALDGSLYLDYYKQQLTYKQPYIEQDMTFGRLLKNSINR